MKKHSVRRWGQLLEFRGRNQASTEWMNKKVSKTKLRKLEGRLWELVEGLQNLNRRSWSDLVHVSWFIYSFIYLVMLGTTDGRQTPCPELCGAPGVMYHFHVVNMESQWPMLMNLLWDVRKRQKSKASRNSHHHFLMWRRLGMGQAEQKEDEEFDFNMGMLSFCLDISMEK